MGRLITGMTPARGGPGAGTIEAAEEAGLVFAFRARCVAIIVVSLVLLAFVQWPRNLYYLSFAAGLFACGYVPFRLRRVRYAEAIKLGFVLLDVALLTGAVFNLPASPVSVDWPIQTRLKTQNFLLILPLLGEAALTYSARRVAWTGAAIVAIWSAAFTYVYTLPDSKRFSDIRLQRTDGELLETFLDPTYVSLPSFATQVAATTFLTALLAVAVQRSRDHLVARVEAERLRQDLARYVSPDVAEALASRSAAELGAPATRQVAVLFADIVGFTRWSERLSPARTFAVLRSFQETATEAVFRHGGTLDKYLGDGFMATFGSLQEEEDAAARAVACAFDLHATIERWNAERSGEGADRLALAIGVHCGPAAVGNLGSESRLEFTAVGDVVNVASRLEQATRELGCRLAISDDCLRAAGPAGGGAGRFARTVELRLRGREAPLLVHVA